MTSEVLCSHISTRILSKNPEMKKKNQIKIKEMTTRTTDRGDLGGWRPSAIQQRAPLHMIETWKELRRNSEQTKK